MANRGSASLKLFHPPPTQSNAQMVAGPLGISASFTYEDLHNPLRRSRAPQAKREESEHGSNPVARSVEVELRSARLAEEHRRSEHSTIRLSGRASRGGGRSAERSGKLRKPTTNAGISSGGISRPSPVAAPTLARPRTGTPFLLVRFL